MGRQSCARRNCAAGIARVYREVVVEGGPAAHAADEEEQAAARREEPAREEEDAAEGAVQRRRRRRRHLLVGWVLLPPLALGGALGLYGASTLGLPARRKRPPEKDKDKDGANGEDASATPGSAATAGIAHRTP